MTGTWHITEMEMWDEDYINMEQQAYIRIQESGGGDFQFGLVSGVIDGHVETLDSGARFSFTWDGSDEMDPVSGSGWLRPISEEKAEGMIKIHLGDRSVPAFGPKSPVILRLLPRPQCFTGVATDIQFPCIIVDA